jgi:hypothetical protein
MIAEAQAGRNGERQKQEGPAQFIVGLDLGQAADFTAMAILQLDRTELGRRAFNCLKVKRWQTGTSYVEIAEALVKLFARPEFVVGDLVIDGTGNRGAVDLIRQARPDAKLRPVNITGGLTEAHGSGGYWNVPKHVLISTTNALLQSKRLRFAEKMEHGETLVRELQSYRVKVSTATGNESFDGRSGVHDDIVLALALGCWWGARGGRRLTYWTREKQGQGEVFDRLAAKEQQFYTT